MESIQRMCCNALQTYLDGELEGSERDAFKGHLERCPSCAQMVAEWQDIKHAYGIWVGQAGEGASDMSLSQQSSAVSTPAQAAQFAAAIAQQLECDGETTRAPVSVITSRMAKGSTGRSWFVVAAVAAAALILVGVWSISRMVDEPMAVPVQLKQHVAQKTEFSPVEKLRVRRSTRTDVAKSTPRYRAGMRFETRDSDQLLVKLPRDQFGLSPVSRLELVKANSEQTVLRLLSGTVACAVSPRQGAQTFVVRAKGVTVTVVGTTFKVEITAGGLVRVGVIQGVVQVARAHDVMELSAGELTIVDGAVMAPPTIVSQADRDTVAALLIEQPLPMAAMKPFDSASDTKPASAVTASPQTVASKALVMTPEKNTKKWRQMILAHDAASARTQMSAYLRHRPKDVAVLLLLATAQKKLGAYADAVATYRKVIAIPNHQMANRARYLAGETAQTKLAGQTGVAAHRQAVGYFEAYLANTSSHASSRAEVTVRLAQSLMALGRNQEARKLVEPLLPDYAHTTVGIRAQRLLDALDRK